MLIKNLLLLAVVVVPLLISCDGTLPKPNCPEIPAAPDYGPPAAQSEKSSVNLDLSASYIKLRVREAVETKIPQDTTLIPNNGVKVNAINLEEKGAGANRLNLISDPAISITVGVTFTRSYYTTGPKDEIIIDASGSAPQGLCGVVNFSLKATAAPRVCRNTSGRSVLQLCEGPSKITPDLGLWSGPCLLFKTIFTGGMAVANTTTPAPLSCPEMSELQFSAGPNDELYATRIDTDGVFYIAGRSQLLDASLGRTPGASTCP